MIRVTLKDHKTNEWIRNRTEVEDIVRRIDSLKLTNWKINKMKNLGGEKKHRQTTTKMV